jgi:MarR family transcriptional regulator, organic hydroperoxide resistance regulator
MAATRSRKKKSKTKPAPLADAAAGAAQTSGQTSPQTAGQASARSPDQASAQTPAQAPSRRATGKGATDNGLFEGFLPHLIARLAYQLNADLIEKLRLEGINIARWRILAVLAMGDGITISEIIDRAMMQQSALSRVLMTMEAEEYVRRVPRRDDGRYVDVFLTEKGRVLFNSLDTVVRRRQNRLLKGFSPQETDAAFAIVRRLIGNLSE